MVSETDVKTEIFLKDDIKVESPDSNGLCDDFDREANGFLPSDSEDEFLIVIKEMKREQQKAIKARKNIEKENGKYVKIREV